MRNLGSKSQNTQSLKWIIMNLQDFSALQLQSSKLKTIMRESFCFAMRLTLHLNMDSQHHRLLIEKTLIMASMIHTLDWFAVLQHSPNNYTAKGFKKKVNCLGYCGSIKNLIYNNSIFKFLNISNKSSANGLNGKPLIPLELRNQILK